MNVLAVPPWRVALSGVCPRCGRAKLFAGLLKFAPVCTSCGLDLTRFNVGDGGTVFLTGIIGTIVVVGAIVLELSVSPPWWVHVLIWPVVGFVLVVLGHALRQGPAAGAGIPQRRGRRAHPRVRLPLIPTLLTALMIPVLLWLGVGSCSGASGRPGCCSS